MTRHALPSIFGLLKGVGLPIARQDCLTVVWPSSDKALVHHSREFGDPPFLEVLASTIESKLETPDRLVRDFLQKPYLIEKSVLQPFLLHFWIPLGPLNRFTLWKFV